MIETTPWFTGRDVLVFAGAVVLAAVVGTVAVVVVEAVARRYARGWLAGLLRRNRSR